MPHTIGNAAPPKHAVSGIFMRLGYTFRGIGPMSGQGRAGAITPPPTPLAPVNSSLPLISGTPQKGQTLSCSTGSWLNSPLTFAYQWLSAGSAISGANGATYLLIAADVAANISCTVTGSNTTGAASATSATVGPVIDLAPVNTVLPALTGTPTVGQVLTVSTGTWNNSPLTFAYAWKLNGSPISGAASVSTYTLTSGENGGNVTCIVTATNSGGSASAISNALGPVGTAGTTPTISAIPTLSGDPVVGQTLFTTNGTWSGTVTSYTYQWFKDGTAIAFATNDNYLILDMDAGSVFLCQVTAYNVAAPSTPAASAATTAVANINLTNAITSFTRTSSSGTVPMTWSLAFGSNVYEGYMTRWEVFPDSSCTDTTQVQDVHYRLTHDDVQPSANLSATLAAAGLTAPTALQYLRVTVYTTSPNSVGYFYTSSAISPTDAVLPLTWNQADKDAAITLTTGNLDISCNGSTNIGCRATQSKTTGKWYFEYKVISTGNNHSVGWADGTAALTGGGNDTHSVQCFNSGAFWYNSSAPGSISAWSVNDIVQCCVDVPNQKVWFGLNNTFSGSPSAGTGGLSVALTTYFPDFFAKAGEGLAKFTSASQTYSPPTGFTAIG